MFNTPHSNIYNLLLIPKSHDITLHHEKVMEILESHHVFSNLFNLEKQISPIIQRIEHGGLCISSEWFQNNIEAEERYLAELKKKLASHLGIFNDTNLNEKFGIFCQKNKLPKASMTNLKHYEKVHPIYPMIDDYKRISTFLNQWNVRMRRQGVLHDNGDVTIHGKWCSYSSFTGRITAKNLPLTSLPRTLRSQTITPTGSNILCVDMNSAELRFLANWSHDNSLIHLIERNTDPFKAIAESTSLSLEQEVIREVIKIITYGSMYGAGGRVLVSEAQKIYQNVTPSDVDLLTLTIKNSFPFAIEFLEERSRSSELLTAFGSIRPNVVFKSTQKRNFTIQSSLSIAIKLLMTTLHSKGLEIIHVLHDEVWVLVGTKEDVRAMFQAIETYKKDVVKIFDNFPTENLFKIKSLNGGIKYDTVN